MRNNSTECLICGEGLEYLNHIETMECSICHRKVENNVRCVKGHYVCDECHTSGVESIVEHCLKTNWKNPLEIMEELMSKPFCHMHGPEHHIMVGASIITAYKNAGGEVDLLEALTEIVRRGKQVPGGACGNWGACGAGISAGMAVSIITQSNPLAKEAWSLSNKMTSKALSNIAQYGGPRCCKRDSYLSILAAIDFLNENMGSDLEKSETIECKRSMLNNQCIGSECPFNKQNKRKILENIKLISNFEK